MGAAFGGQVLTETKSAQRWLAEDTSNSWTLVNIGMCGFKGLASPMDVSNVVSNRGIFRARTYPAGVAGKKAWVVDISAEKEDSLSGSEAGEEPLSPLFSAMESRRPSRRRAATATGDPER